MRPQTYSKERISLNIVRLRKGGEDFEIIVSDPNAALKLRQGDESVRVHDVLRSPEIFNDAKKGEAASTQRMDTLFGTSNPDAVAKVIIKEGEFHLTAEQKRDIIEKKKAQIIDYVHMNALDPKTRLPHPRQRIELAMEEVKTHIDIHNRVESQIDKIIEKLQPILPMSFEKVRLQVLVPASSAARAFSILKTRYRAGSEVWNNDGSVQFDLTVPAGLKPEILNLINSLTRGEARIEELKK